MRIIKGRAGRICGRLLLCLAVFYAFLRFSPYPSLNAFRSRPNSIRFYDRNGLLIQISALDDGLRREYRPLEEIPDPLKTVFIHAEDGRFYHHWGIDLIAIGRAFFQNLSSGRRISGASTITMQLARLMEMDAGDTGHRRGRGLINKTKEALNALRLEARLNKDEILELYLNSIPFGFQTEGVVSAARTFFSADIQMLSPAQIFCLAVIPRRPNTNNPLSEKENCASAATALHSRFIQNR